MIAYLKGCVLEALPHRLIVENQGIGYQVSVPLSTYDALHPTPGDTVELHTYLHIRENIQALYGFSSTEQKELFLLLIERVSGLGPSIALSILSGMPVKEFKNCVVNQDDKALSQIKGLGPKTSQRIILELKDKVGVTDSWQASASTTESSFIADTKAALIGLGYKKNEAHSAVEAARKLQLEKDLTSEELLRNALRILNA